MGTKKGEVYKCNQCGNVVTVLQEGGGDLVCCGEEMQLVSDSDAQNFLSGLPKPGAIA
jgi:superoxide reductase